MCGFVLFSGSVVLVGMFYFLGGGFCVYGYVGLCFYFLSFDN